MAERFPLSWPEGYPVTEYRAESKFKSTFAAARDGIFAELYALGAKDYFISCNVPRNKKGELIEGKLMYNNPGVAVYFKFNGEERVIACDHWKYIHENMRAVGLSIEAIRGLERWKCSDIISRAMGDMKALPAGTNVVIGTPRRTWYEVLQVSAFAEFAAVNKQYRALSKRYHPDALETADPDKLHELQEAFAEYKKAKNI